MAVDFQVTRFQKNSSGTNGVTQDVSLNFTPKAIIVFSPSHTADDSFAEVAAPSYGFSDGTNHACFSVRSEDNQVTSDTGGSHRTDAVIGMQHSTTPANVLVRGSCAFITNGVRFTWDINDTNALWIYVIAFGGSDITNVKVNTVDIGTTGTGTADYTGLGFTPVAGESILFTLDNNTTTNNANESICSPSIGCAVSSTKRWAVANTMEDNRAAADTWRYFSSLRCIASLVDTTGAVDYLADFNGWITDGFQLDIEDASASSTNKFSYMVIKGGKWDVGTQNTRTTTGSETTTVDAALATMKGVFTATHATTTVNSVATVTHLGIGASDGTNEGCMAFLERTALDPTQNISRHNNAGILMYGVVTTAASPFTPSVILQGEFTSFGTNQFTVNHTVATGAAYPVGWWAVGEAAAVAAVEEISYQSYGNILQQFDSNKNVIFG